jgi:hypothetical protein
MLVVFSCCAVAQSGTDTVEWLQSRFAKVADNDHSILEGTLFNLSVDEDTLRYSVSGNSSIQSEGDADENGSPLGHWVLPYTEYRVDFVRLKGITATTDSVIFKGAIRKCFYSGLRGESSPDCDTVSIAYLPMRDVDGSSASLRRAFTHLAELKGVKFLNDDLFGQ